MATYLPQLSNKNYDLLTSHRGDEKVASATGNIFGTGNGVMYQNQAPLTFGSYSAILPATSMLSNNHVHSIDGSENEMMFIPPMGNQTSSSFTEGPFSVQRTQLGGTGTLLSQKNLHYQGLSLSLATQIPSAPSFQYHYSNPSLSSVLCTSVPISENGPISCPGGEDNQDRELRNVCMVSGFLGGSSLDMIKTDNFNNSLCSVGIKEMYTDSYSYQPSNVTNTILNSTYLKVAQELLDDVVNVRKALTQLKNQKHEGINSDGSKENDGRPHDQCFRSSSDQCESSINSSTELSPEERQDLQNKKTRLLFMLEDVDRRYKQYYHQTQIIISIFDKVAGQGAAEIYTALSKRTISCHFRCLRDAISEQIQVTLRKLGEQDTSSNGQEVMPRLRYVDQQLREQRALQQLGVMRHAWRPQRGLPESSVSILRAWLFEHFLHPYPKDSEKIMLARQTGLTKNQVANWFINARVRLWKPMIEEMYKEEFGDSDMKSKLDNALREQKDPSASKDRREDLQNSTMTRTSDSINAGKVHSSNCNHTFSADNNAKEKISIHSSFHEDNIMDSGISKFLPYMDGHSFYLDETFCTNQNGDRSLMATAASYDIAQFDGFAGGSQVSLALKLQNCESDGMSVPGGSNVRGNDAADSLGYHCLDPGQQDSRYNKHHLLHDFVV